MPIIFQAEKMNLLVSKGAISLLNLSEAKMTKLAHQNKITYTPVLLDNDMNYAIMDGTWLVTLYQFSDEVIKKQNNQ